MQYIDKNNAVAEASVKSIVDPYIIAGHKRYDDLSDADRRSVRNVLGDEQNQRCCYCVREIAQGAQTVEHLIPKKISLPGFGRAYGHMGGGLYRNDILYEGRFTPISYPRYYPHPLAYGNLTMACEECNEAKGGEDEGGFIRPLFFANPVVGVSYNEKGRMSLAQKDAMPERLKTRINNDTFVQIRSIWRAFKLAGVTVTEVRNAIDEVSRKALFHRALPHVENNVVKTEIEKRDCTRFTAEGTWREIISFSWFWSYYH